jgi:hypothetical protein
METNDIDTTNEILDVAIVVAVFLAIYTAAANAL